MKEDSTIRRSARERAVKALVASYDGEAFCHDLLSDMQRRDPLLPADVALAAELAIGVARHRITCEHIAARFYRGRWLGLRVPVRVILALGVYQLCRLDRIPAHAAVDEAVRQAKRHGRGTSATVNAVLRKVASQRGNVVDRPVEPDARRYLPLDADRGRVFAEPIFPDPARRPLEYLVAATGHPSWLVERWHRRFKPKICREVCDAGNRRPPLVLRPNPLRTTAPDLRDRLLADGLAAQLSEDGESVLLPAGPPASSIEPIRQGLCQPQDTTSQIPLRLGLPKPGEVVVDLCAGAGTKSTQAAEMMNDDGSVIATDIHEHKLAALDAAAERLGISIIRSTPKERLAAVLAECARPPDLILVDVPCLNTGVLARRPEARYRAGRKALDSIVALQATLLNEAQAMSGPRTRIIYATCSLEPEENEQQMGRFCEAFPAWKVDEERFTLPAEDHDGGYAAVLIRTP